MASLILLEQNTGHGRCTHPCIQSLCPRIAVDSMHHVQLQRGATASPEVMLNAQEAYYYSLALTGKSGTDHEVNWISKNCKNPESLMMIT